MTGGLADVMEPARWPTFALASARVAGMVMIAPIWSIGTIPMRIRGAMAVVITLALLPMIPDATIAAEPAGLVPALLTELLIGTSVGLSAMVFLHGVSVAAEVMALQMGLSLGAALGGSEDLGDPGIGQLQMRFALVGFVIFGGPAALVGAVARSFTTIAPGGGIDLAQGAMKVALLGSALFSAAVAIAAPIIVALLAANVALAILNRAVPQLNTMMVAVPVTVSVGLVVLGAALPFTIHVVADWAGQAGGGADAIVRGFVLPAGVR